MKIKAWMIGLGASTAAVLMMAAACGDDSAVDDQSATNGGGGAGASGGNGGDGAGGAGGSPTCGSSTPASLGACVEQSRYETDLTFIEGARAPGDPHHQEVQDLCATRFAEAGFDVELHNYGSGTNVIGVKPGGSTERVLIGAHYDSTQNCPGADDNGSGVAGLLEAARVLGPGSFDGTLVVACWDEEELGLVGSEAYAQRAAANGENIVGVFTFEMIGFYNDAVDSQTLPFGFDLVFPEEAAQVTDNESRGDFLAIIGDESMQQGIDLLDKYCDTFGIKGLAVTLAADQKNDPLYGDLQRSDHAPFWAEDFPALHMTDTSEFRYDAYHCAGGQDVMSNLDHGFATGIVAATVAATAELLGM